MVARPARCRPGYTLVEVMVTFTVMVVLGALSAPALHMMQRDTPVTEAGDIVRGQVAQARAHAIGDGRAYRLSVSPAGDQVRVAPDSADDATDGDTDPPYYADKPLPANVRATPRPSSSGDAGMGGEDGWVKVATFLPDGTCREDDAEMDLSEPGCYALRLTVRGLTGSATLTKLPVAPGAAP